MNFSNSVLVTAMAATLSLPAIAEEQSPIIVTATRTAQTVDESLAAVTVISRQEIESSQAISIAEVLRKHTGMNVTTQGGVGKSESVFLRGTEAGHILVLVDGVRASSATTGEFAWERMTAEQIEKIEIVSGPRASLYGSDAIGGVISITTREAKKTTASVSYGSYDTKQLNISTGGGKDWKYSFSMGQLTTEGFPTREKDTEDFGHKRNHFTATLKKQLTPDTSLKTSINHAQGSNEHETSTGDSEFKNQIINITIDSLINDSWNQKLIIGHNTDQYTTHSPTTPSTITTTRKSASWQHDIFVGNNTTTAGIDYWQDHATKNNSGLIDQKIDNAGLFVQQQWNTETNDVIISARSDKHSEFGEKVTGSLAWGHNFGKNRLVLSYGTAFKAPSVNDLFWPYSTSVYKGTTYTTKGNPNIKPELSKTSEISWRAKPSKNVTWNTSVYQTEIDDLIDWASSKTAANEYTYIPVNVDSVTINGLESTVTYKIEDWEVNANITFLDAKNNETKKQLDRRPERSFNVTLTRNVQNKQYSIEVLSASERNDRNGAVELDPYTLINILYSNNITKDLKANFRIDNIANTEYTLARSPSGNYNTPGRNAHIGLNYTF